MYTYMLTNTHTHRKEVIEPSKENIAPSLRIPLVTMVAYTRALCKHVCKHTSEEDCCPKISEGTVTNSINT